MVPGGGADGVRGQTCQCTWWGGLEFSWPECIPVVSYLLCKFSILPSSLSELQKHMSRSQRRESCNIRRSRTKLSHSKLTGGEPNPMCVAPYPSPNLLRGDLFSPKNLAIRKLHHNYTQRHFAIIRQNVCLLCPTKASWTPRIRIAKSH